MTRGDKGKLFILLFLYLLSLSQQDCVLPLAAETCFTLDNFNSKMNTIIQEHVENVQVLEVAVSPISDTKTTVQIGSGGLLTVSSLDRDLHLFSLLF